MTASTDGDRGSALADAAQQLVGRRFRLHGRNPETGLDCIGLVTAALYAIGARPIAPSGYALRNLSVDHWLRHAGQSGLVASPGPARTGDVLLIALGYCQHHLAIAASDTSVVHAHASLRQVVHQPLEPTWQIVAKWRAAPLMKE
jgi:cell wall-associated NlpC family hydrolase